MRARRAQKQPVSELVVGVGVGVVAVVGGDAQSVLPVT